MSADSFRIVVAGVIGVFALLIATFAGVWMTHTFHDWDCSKHGGVVDFKVPAVLAPQLTHKVCSDGYVP